VSTPVFVEDEGVNSGAEVEGVEAMAFECSSRMRIAVEKAFGLGN